MSDDAAICSRRLVEEKLHSPLWKIVHWSPHSAVARSCFFERPF